MLIIIEALDVNQIPESNIGQAEGVIGNFYNFTAVCFRIPLK